MHMCAPQCGSIAKVSSMTRWWGSNRTAHAHTIDRTQEGGVPGSRVTDIASQRQCCVYIVRESWKGNWAHTCISVTGGMDSRLSGDPKSGPLSDSLTTFSAAVLLPLVIIVTYLETKTMGNEKTRGKPVPRLKPRPYEIVFHPCPIVCSHRSYPLQLNHRRDTTEHESEMPACA